MATAKDVYELLDEQFGGRTEVGSTPDTFAATNADQIMLRQEPRRIALTIINLGAAAIFIRPNGVASASAGIQIAPGGNVSMSVRDDFHLPSLEWHVVSPGGNQTVGVYPVLLRGNGE